ncbi:zinc ABC transporter substrate-binding protein [Methanococcoides methylutens]|uniref:Zinc ABC transporter substrate-binding protein n=1 Tax=Methanococcoides methylutens TaxID=2226 RepID=A0A099SY36_METMT|nr:zinc ABC transporter substrate-binding protein [Methanococcoides methylutens]KGK97817.1 zinc ABC transporter substrate-binding protein [Methanococcoides methylutens]
MNRNIKLILGIFTLLVAISTSGCIDQTEENSSQDDAIVVAVSILPQQEFVDKIAGDRVNVVVLIPPGASPATHEPTAGQLRDVADARAYFTVGSGLPFENVWLEKIETVNEDMLIVDCSEGIQIIEMHEEEHEEEQNAEEGEAEAGHDHGGVDPHVWTSPMNAKIMVENTYLGLIEIDPDNSEFYLQNKKAYLKELDEADARIRDTLGEEGGSFMTYHPSWNYFATEYGLDMITIEEEGKEPSPRDMQRLIDEAEEKNIKVIFVQAQFSTQSAEAIASEIGGEVVTVDPLAKDYIDNLDIITEAFSHGITKE